VGYVGLCDLSGHNVTSGSIHSTPFVWKAVSSVQPPAAYRGVGENAVLNVYQARQDIDPQDWTGLNLVPATDYKRPKQPTAIATYKDYPFTQATLSLPPMWNGMYVLRMQYGKTGFGIYSATYPQTVIQVSGDQWHVISGGLVDCSSAKAVPQEVITGVAKKLTAPAATKNQTPTSAAPADRATGSVTSGATSSGTTTGSGTSSTASNSNGLTATVADPITAPLAGSSRTSSGLIAVIAVAALIVIGLGAAVLTRRRRTSA
jgi:hypothetical protein